MKKLVLVLAVCMVSLAALAQSSDKGKVIHLNDNSFKEKVFDFEKEKEWNFKGNRPVLVDFYATWCGPCKKIAPVLEELQKEYGESIQIYKVDTDKAKEVAAAFGIRSIPSLLFIPMKGQPQMAQGALPKETFIKAIKDVMGVDHPNASKE